MKFIDRAIQEALLAGQKVYHGKNCYYIDNGVDGILIQENASGKMAAILSKKDLSTTDWSLCQPVYDYYAIIKDEVLCRFWNDSDVVSNYIYGKLASVKDGRFNLRHSSIYFDNCEPVGIPDITIAGNPDFYRR